MKKFAFVIMDGNADPQRHRYSFETGGMTNYFRSVRNYDEALTTIRELQKDGVGVVELCGAFGREQALSLIEATGNTLGIGYVVHEPSQDDLFRDFFA